MISFNKKTATGQEQAEKLHLRERITNPEAITWRNIRRSWQAYLLLLPIFALLIIFVYYPPVLGLFRAFYEWRPGKEPIFIGLQNFQTYFANADTPLEIVNIAKLLYWGLLTSVVVPFIMAELIFAIRSVSIKELYRFLVVVPMLVPGVVFTLLWRHLYDPALGPINKLLEITGLGFLARNWLGDPATALYAIIFVGFPWVATINTLIYLGGLAQISDSVFDACLLDGCTGLNRILRIDIPLVLGQVRMLTILAGINALTSFNSVLILTRGGPGYATSVPGFRMYERAFISGQFGYGSAIGLMLFVLAMLLTFIISKAIRPVSE
jgi:raffinose/stachyose/melibiose transport system permease protein